MKKKSYKKVVKESKRNYRLGKFYSMIYGISGKIAVYSRNEALKSVKRLERNEKLLCEMIGNLTD